MNFFLNLFPNFSIYIFVHCEVFDLLLIYTKDEFKMLHRKEQKDKV